MAKILYLVHRLPYPPNKGDKVRSYHLLKHLATHHQVFLGTFVDDPQDWKYVDNLRGLCADIHAAELQPLKARVSSLKGILNGEALSLAYYRDPGLSNWIETTAAVHEFDAVVVFSSPMAQYAAALPNLPMLVDFVDVDSAKWSDYATARRWPMSWLYKREGRTLLAFEQSVAARACCSFFVTDKEVALFRELSPTLSADIEPLCNGVDAEFFSPLVGRASPFDAGQLSLVFTGAMDYWPNVDAVCWFAAEVLPELRKTWPQLHFHIVGRNPTPAVKALAGEHVHVTGTVSDVRPYLQHAAVVVAPLRLARGIQNKVLEAMAMARPVVAAASCVQAIRVEEGVELLGADTAADYQQQIFRLLSAPELAERMGRAGRERVTLSYSWDAHLTGIDRYINSIASSEKVSA